MKSEQRRWNSQDGWISQQAGESVNGNSQLVLMFGSVEAVHHSGAMKLARSLYPHARLAGCTTSGEIQSGLKLQGTVVMSALAFDHSRVEVSHLQVLAQGDCRQAGEKLVRGLPSAGLRHILLFSDGVQLNAGRLMEGVARAIPPGVTLSGGCAGDMDRMLETHVWCDCEPKTRTIAAIGLYGERLRVFSGVTGAWGPLGPDRLVTKSRDNVLYELDGRSALGLYKRYLGDYAAQLPASGLLFPLLVHPPGSTRSVLRALVGCDEAAQSITFAGDIVEGSRARFMRGSIERLLEDTLLTARSIHQRLAGRTPEFTLLVSCNGRRHVLRQRIDEEIEAVAESLGGSCLTGFYSHGEFGPVAEGDPPELHNETMTITTLLEA